MWASGLGRRSTEKGQASHFYRAVLPGLCLPLANYLAYFSTPDLPWGPFLGAHTPISQDGTLSEGRWEEQDPLWPGGMP